MHVLSLLVPTLLGAEIVGDDFARCRVCEVPKCPVFPPCLSKIVQFVKMWKETTEESSN